MNSATDPNRRETGRRVARTARTSNLDDFSQDAAENRKPAGSFGLSEPVNETQAKTRKSGGVRPSRKQEKVRGRAAGDGS